MLTRRLAPILLAFACISPFSAVANTEPAEASKGVALGSAGFDELLAKQLAPGTLKTEALPDGSYILTNSIQALQAQVTLQGTTFTSTSKEQDKAGSFSLQLAALGREGAVQPVSSGRVYAQDAVVYHTHSAGIAEKFSNSGNGIRQDFLVPVKPQGSGSLQLQLAIEGATLSSKDDGFTVALNHSTRTLTYDRLKVTDANNKTIPAHMQLLASNEINIVVDDSTAQYPLTIDPTVGDANWVSMGADAEVYAIAINGPDIYAGGAFTVIEGVPANRIAKWNGTMWSALGSGMNGTVKALIMSPDGSLYAGGLFSSAGGIGASSIAKWNGTTWSALGSGVTGSGFNKGVNALALDSSGNLYAGGAFNSAGGVANTAKIAKWNGSAWNPLGTGMNGAVFALVVDGAGHLYAGGFFTTADGLTVNRIARWDGSAWNTLGTGMSSEVNALALDGNGNLFAGGLFASAGGSVANYIARWDGSTWSALGSGMNSGVLALAFDSSGNLYAGGYFTAAGGTAANHVARWDGSTWSVLGSGVDHYAHALAFSNNGGLYVGGQFIKAGNKSSPWFSRYVILDSDSDGVGDEVDPFPFDTDNDGVDNVTDDDDDGDGIPDAIDTSPLMPLGVNGVYKGSTITDRQSVQ